MSAVIICITITIAYFYSVSSAAAQTFLQDIFSSFFTTNLQVRLTSLTVLNLILRQGLVHPAQVCCIKYTL